MELMIEDLMTQLVKGGGSDLHLSVGQPPYGRFNGKLTPMREEILTEQECNQLIFSLVNNFPTQTT
jgi:twitching motility protein PilT